MPDEAVESSPTVETPKAATFEVPSSPKEYATWRQTGKLPEQPKKAESAPAESSDAEPEKKGEEKSDEVSRTATGSDPEKKMEHKPSKAEARLNELLETIRETGYTPAELKTLRKREAQKATEIPPPPKPEHTAKPADGPVKPRAEDFKTWEEYEAARDKYFEDLADFRSQKAVSEFSAKQAREAMERDLLEKVSKARERYGDGADTAIVSTAKEIFAGSRVPPVLREVMSNSPVLVDLMYAIGSKPEELASFLELAETNPGQALRKAVLIERLVQEELAKPASGGSPDEPARNENGQFAGKAAPKKETSAPPPPKEVSGRSGPPADEVDKAAESQDFRAYRTAANRRDIQRAKGL